MKNPECRPATAASAPNFAAYDTVYLGFPIWWGREPSVVDTFIDQADWSGKTVVPFCTSGMTGVEGAAARIAELTAGKAAVAEGKRLAADVTAESIRSWICGE